MANTKFKIGDMFTRKNTRDEIPLEITSIHQEYEPIYTLTPIRLCGDELVLGEEALIALYNKIN